MSFLYAYSFSFLILFGISFSFSYANITASQRLTKSPMMLHVFEQHVRLPIYNRLSYLLTYF